MFIFTRTVIDFFCIYLQVEIDIIDIIRLHTLFAYEQQT